jgi:heptaprenyl diphosphate synthase
MPTASSSEKLWQRLVPLAAAVSLFLATIEYIIPRPLPFLRLGLANLPLLLTLDLLPPVPFLLLIGLKILGQSLIQGSLFSVIFLFSAAGNLASGLLMYGAYRLFAGRMSLIGISILGALASNLSQLALARVFVFGPSAWLIAPPFLLVGLATSTALGVAAQQYRKRSVWLKKVAKAIESAQARERGVRAGRKRASR